MGAHLSILAEMYDSYIFNRFGWQIGYCDQITSLATFHGRTTHNNSSSELYT